MRLLTSHNHSKHISLFPKLDLQGCVVIIDDGEIGLDGNLWKTLNDFSLLYLR